MLCMISILFNGFLQGRNKTDCILQQTTVAIVFVWIFYDIMGQVTKLFNSIVRKWFNLRHKILFSHSGHSLHICSKSCHHDERDCCPHYRHLYGPISACFQENVVKARQSHKRRGYSFNLTLSMQCESTKIKIFFLNLMSLPCCSNL